MSRKFIRSVDGFKNSLSQRENELSGRLGIPLGGQLLVNVPNRTPFVYVRLRNSQNEVIQAYNNQVSPSYDLPVRVVWEGTRYIIKGVESLQYGGNWGSTSAFIPPHGYTHSVNPEGGGGSDPVWVYGKQFMPMLTIPSGSSGALNVVVSPYTLKDLDGNWIYIGNTGTPDLSPYKPTDNQAVMVLVYVDASSGNPYILAGTGTPFDASITGTAAVLPYVPSFSNDPNKLPDSAIRLVSGTSFIGWDNIYDLRQYIPAVPTGSFLYSEVQDEGAPQGQVTTFNFVGPNVDASVSGTVIRVYVTGSSGGGSSSNYSGTAIQDEGEPQGLAQTFNFVGPNVDASVSGTVARIFITGSGIPSGTIQIFNTGTFVGSSDKLDFQFPLAVGVTGTRAYPYFEGTLLAYEDVSEQITGSNTHFVLTGTIALGTDRLYYNGLRQQRTTHYTVDSNGKGFSTSFTGTYGDVMMMEYGNLGVSSIGITMDQADPYGIFHRLDATDPDDDEFDNGSIDAAFTQISPTGLVTWTEANHTLSAVFSGQSANDIAAILKPTTLSDGEAYETCMRIWSLYDASHFSMFGLAISDGVVATSNVLTILCYLDFTANKFNVELWKGTITNVATAGTARAYAHPLTGSLRIKLLRNASNSYSSLIGSIDGSQFNAFGAAVMDPGFTPSHAGLFVSAWGGSTIGLASFDYLRVIAP